MFGECSTPVRRSPLHIGPRIGPGRIAPETDGHLRREARYKTLVHAASINWTPALSFGGFLWSRRRERLLGVGRPDGRHRLRHPRRAGDRPGAAYSTALDWRS